MRTLAIDCATEACSVALFQDAERIAGDWRMLGRGHAEQLVPMIAALPGKGRADRIAVGLGPGSFTGVRVGLAASRALAFAWNAELIGFPTLALVAAQARAARGGTALAVAMTGGHGEWFIQRFDSAGSPFDAVSSLRPLEAAEIADDCIAGSQAEALVALRGGGTALPLWPDVRHFAALPTGALTQEVVPLYGRAPDAKLPAAAGAA